MNKKEDILQCAAKMYLRLGIKSVTMDDISRELGISKKTLYQFVENKTDLINQIIQQHIVEEKEIMKDIRTTSTNAIDALARIAKYNTQQLRDMSPTTMYDLKKYYRESWQLMESLHEKHVYEIISENLERGKKEGLYKGDLDSDIAAKLYVITSLLIVDEQLFPSREYNREFLFGEYIKLFGRGIVTAKGLKLLEKFTNQVT